jgi:hypothetical protein
MNRELFTILAALGLAMLTASAIALLHSDPLARETR